MPYRFTNEQIADLLREVLACYEAEGSNPFKTAAYANAVSAIEKLDLDVEDMWAEGRLKDISGVGKSLEKHLDELFRTGRVLHFDKVKSAFPKGMFGLLRIPGIGAKTAFKLSSELKLNNYENSVLELKEAAESGKIRDLRGFSTISENKILQSIIKMLQTKKERRLPLYKAENISSKLLSYLNGFPKVLKSDVLGSVRRRAATVGDIDISVATKDPKSVINYFLKYPKIAKILSSGDVKASVVLLNNVQVDIMTQDPDSYGALLQHFTGAKQHNIHLRKIALDKGLSLSEYGIKKGPQTLKFAAEKDFYSFLGMQYIPPELREGSGEIERALKRKLPKLVSLSDIKGDLHSHTTYSDGKNSFAEMTSYAESLGYEYFGITDHPMSLVANTKSRVIASVEARRKEIEHYNSSHSNVRVFFGIEMEVSADNSIIYPNDILRKFDYVIGAIHSSFNQSKDRITERLLTLIENPYIKIIAHPTGRLLLGRDGYNVDWETVFRACKEHNKVLEINGQPTRLDLPDSLVREAIGSGVLLVANTDAHSISDLNLMRYAVSVARRGWCEKSNVINTMPLVELLKFLEV